MDVTMIIVFVNLYLMSMALGISVAMVISMGNVGGTNYPVWVRRAVLISTFLGFGVIVGVVMSIAFLFVNHKLVLSNIWKD